MLSGISEPFRRIESIQFMMDSETSGSKRCGAITFGTDSERAKKGFGTA
jgi:RNA-binding protein 39